MNSTENKYQTFKGQERNDELGLNWLSFKWRNHDPAIGRFMSIDPLAEKFFYNSPYAFSENKVTSHFELEGLEAVLAITFGKDVRYRGDIIQQAQPNAQHTNINTPNQGTSDFVSAFRTASASDSQGIGFAAIWGHGVPGRIYASGNYSDVNVTTSGLDQLNTAIKNGEVSFTDNAVIFIGNCNSGTCGSGDPSSFAQRLSEITGATVIGANDSVGLGYPNPNPENINTMEFTVWDPSSKEFISFDQANSQGIGPSVDVIRLMNRTLNPPTPVNSITPAGITPMPSALPSASTTLRANAGAGEEQFYINLPNGSRIRRDEIMPGQF
ncbi:hypothetical protein [uncultured Algibacter sp.]|uniref:hypothetical protein n=1 Tax=uncultured Algibacter sp. TaxID=298659 RepID=UPI002615844D|nr:hypothetical protein [uncultured Algibacter sp.]